ncbi:uncharacterized protein TNCV_4041171 [Trichonephila clavipes]|nr:uncharacterized protein TNCV_4041171 [Trichonephila clavipes]
MLSVGPDAMAQPVTVPEEKGLPRVLLISADERCEETSVDVIKETAKEDINPVVLSRDPLNLDDDEMEEVEQKREVEKPARTLPFIQRIVMRKRPTMQKKVRLKSRMSDIDSPKLQNSVFKRLAKWKVTIQGDLW